jgi:16S rRNA (uracil1498-N3)-methyltransferase
MRRRFFVQQFAGSVAVLRGEGAEHLGRVLRAQPGQQYELSDGQRVWLARVERISLSKRGEALVEFALVEPVQSRESLLHIRLQISIVKFDRFERCLEKATELGASEIIPLRAARTDKVLIAAATKRLERWNKVALEAAQQSRQLRSPTIHPVMRPLDAFAQASGTHKLFFSERPDAMPLREVFSGYAADSANAAARHVVLAFGPEGGWTDDEVVGAGKHGFAEVSLGSNILRAETAVIAALAVVQFAMG